MTLLPNTSGARNADEAVRIARLARELGCGDFVKIEIMRDSKYLLPDNQEDDKSHRDTGKGGLCGDAVHVPDLNAARGHGGSGSCKHNAAGITHRLQQGAFPPEILYRY